MTEIFSRQAADICKVNPKTFDNWVRDGIVKVVNTVPRVINGKERPMRLFDEAAIRRFAKKLPKKRGPGQPLILSKGKRRK